MSSGSISRWKSGTIPNGDTLQKIADYFNVSTDYLLNGPSKVTGATKKGVKIPVLGYVRAGVPIEAVQEILDYEEIPEEWTRMGEYFGLSIKGSSMEPRICEGDVVIVKKQSDVDSGDVAIVLINGQDATVKKVIKNTAGITLMPFNPTYQPVVFCKKEIMELPVTIIGKVVELRGKF